MIERYSRTCPVDESADWAPHPMTHIKREKPNVITAATIWFSVKEDANIPIET